VEGGHTYLKVGAMVRGWRIVPFYGKRLRRTRIKGVKPDAQFVSILPLSGY
jgi:hypothetical protein